MHGAWIGRWRDDGQPQSRKLGNISQMTKSQAREALADILRPINARTESATPDRKFGDFVDNVFFPFYRRKWKRSTKMTTEDRIKFYLIGEFKEEKLVDMTREELQTFLDEKSKTLSFSTVDHLRWDLRQICRMAVNEGRIRRNPAELLFTKNES
jgi:hypothetical protein